MAPYSNGGIHPPIGVVVQWPTPNYENPVTRHGALSITVILTLLTVLIVGIRIYVRGIMQGAMGLDDWIVLAAMVWLPRVRNFNIAKLIRYQLLRWQ